MAGQPAQHRVDRVRGIESPQYCFHQGVDDRVFRRLADGMRHKPGRAQALVPYKIYILVRIQARHSGREAPPVILRRRGWIRLNQIL